MADGHRQIQALPGEMILNAQQQANLFAMANSKKGQGGLPPIVVNLNAGHIAQPDQIRELVQNAVRDAIRLNPTVLTVD